MKNGCSKKILSETTIEVSSDDLQIETAKSYYGEEIENVTFPELSKKYEIVQTTNKIVEFMLKNKQEKFQTFLKTFFDAENTENYQWDFQKIKIENVHNNRSAETTSIRESSEHNESFYTNDETENENTVSIFTLSQTERTFTPVVVIETSNETYELVYGKTIMDKFNSRRRNMTCLVGSRNFD